MSEQDVELVRRICDLHARGDYKAASKLIHKKMPYHHHHGFDDYPDARTYRDYKAIVGYLREFWESWEESEITPAEFIDAGDGRVVALLSFVGRGKGSSVQLERRFAEIWTVRDGKAVDFQLYRYPNQAFSAAGVDRKVV
jgi:uncharacterized protein